MKFIGERISYQKKDNIFSVVIAANVDKSYERLLLVWLVLWTCCGAYFVFQLLGDLSKDLKLYIAILLSFWAYYEFKIGRVYFWRKGGFESIKIIDDKLVVKEVVFGRSLPKNFFLENIGRFEADDPKDTNLLEALNQSFWVKGAQYILFDYQGKRISFGRQLNKNERKSLVTLLNNELIQKRKKL